MEQIICTDEEKNKIVEFLKEKEKNGKIISKEYIIKAIILWEVNIFQKIKIPICVIYFTNL